MKRIMIIIFAFMLIILPLKVFALSASPSITCNKNSLKAEESTVCEFKLNVSDGKIAGISAKYSYDSTYANVLVENYGNWQGNALSGQIDYYDWEDHTGDVTIAKITYKVKDDISVSETKISDLSINVIELTDENGTAVKPNLNVKNTFNILPTNVVTTKKQETNSTSTTTTTAKKATSTIKKTTSKKNNATTSTTKSIETTNSTTTIKAVTTKTISTTKKIIKKNSYNFGIVFGLSILFILILVAIITLIIKEKKKKEEI